MVRAVEAMVSPDTGSVHAMIPMIAVMSFAAYVFISYASTQYPFILGSVLYYYSIIGI